MLAHSVREIAALLDQLEVEPAESLEGQDLDFKEWVTRSHRDAVAQMIEMAVCMANGGGGTVVFGVRDRVVGRAAAIVGVPEDVDRDRLGAAVYDATDPKIIPDIAELPVPEGTGRLLVMQVQAGLAPYTDTRGAGKVRMGSECKPLTGSMRRRVHVETGESDLTAEPVEGRPEAMLSAAALERLRDVARAERAPSDLTELSDLDLLGALDLLREGRLLRAGILLAGNEAAIERHVPHYLWTHLRMRSDTDYEDRADGGQAIPLALDRLVDRIMADNPISTVEQGLFHFEYRAYPEVALREALLNALCHADFRGGGPILVRQYRSGLEIANPGTFIGGVTPENILHHPPAARNPALVAALVRLRLVNRSNLGIGRMFRAMLTEGKEPPTIVERGGAVVVGFRRQEIAVPFRAFVEEEARAGRMLGVDHLLILHRLLSAPELDSATAGSLCQRSADEARGLLTEMETAFGYLERGGTGRGTYWTMRPDLHRKLAGAGLAERDRRIDWDAAKLRVHSVLLDRRRRGESGLTNAEVRALTHLGRHQVHRLMRQLEEERVARIQGHGRGARYEAV
ncbi:MAG: AAA family ATPase [Rhodospirillaceae bacterium]|nr:AAA family ATPase [Rhodospirillaceae bacterium]